jgi:hypothetical protein
MINNARRRFTPSQRQEAKMRYLPSALFVAALLLPLAALSASHVHADSGVTAAASTYSGDWQLRRLMEPTEAEIARETAGEVVIYDKITDQQVEAAMSAHPERIRNMMFVGTIITDERGEAEIDSYGMFAMEDDGC